MINKNNKLWCSACKKFKDETEFPANNTNKITRRGSYCKVCHKLKYGVIRNKRTKRELFIKKFNSNKEEIFA